MSDDVLSIVPTDHQWRPGRAAAERTAALAGDLAPGVPDGVEAEVEVLWHDALAPVGGGDGLERIGCPHCGASIDTEWYADLLDSHEDGFATLAVDVPCCSTATSLDVLDYGGPYGFARFEIAVWNPARDWFDKGELAALGDALGHPVKQVRTHV
ncbi:hypothetical protein JNUCC64_28275 [Streptomyces sp. JNUCC 64]